MARARLRSLAQTPGEGNETRRRFRAARGCDFEALDQSERAVRKTPRLGPAQERVLQRRLR